VNRVGHLHSVAVARNVHIHDVRRFADQVIVNRSNLKSSCLQSRYHRIHLARQQYQIAVRNNSTGGFSKCHPGAETGSGFDFRLTDMHIQISAWK